MPSSSIKIHTPKLGTSILIEAAQQLGYNHQTINHDYSFIEISLRNKSIKFLGYYPDCNDTVSTRIAKNKHLCSVLLQKAGVPTLKSTVLSIEDLGSNNTKLAILKKIRQFARKFNNKIVIKPLSMLGGKGVTILPKKDEDIIAALNLIKNFGKHKIMIEEYAPIKNEYRLLVHKNSIIDVVQRFPPSVIGNGKSSVEQLLLQEQKSRTKFYSQDKTLEKQTIKQLLAVADISSSFVPTKGQRIMLSKKCNYSLGGTVKKIDLALIHQDYLELVDKIHHAIGINYFGVDLIASDITQSLISTDKVNEINENPGLRIHSYADYLAGNNPINVAMKILESLLEH